MDFRTTLSLFSIHLKVPCGHKMSLEFNHGHAQWPRERGLSQKHAEETGRKKVHSSFFLGVFKRRIYYRPIRFNRKSKQTLRKMAANNEYIHQTALTSQYQKDTSKMLIISSTSWKSMFNGGTFREILLPLSRQYWKKHLSKHSLIKHTFSWRDKLITLWILNRQAKIFLRRLLIASKYSYKNSWISIYWYLLQ